jgi:hypothetical protein
MAKQGKTLNDEMKNRVSSSFDVVFTLANCGLRALLEMIQGPCLENQTLILNIHFRSIAQKILDLEYMSVLEHTKLLFFYWNQIYDAKMYDYRL